MNEHLRPVFDRVKKVLEKPQRTAQKAIRGITMAGVIFVSAACGGEGQHIPPPNSPSTSQESFDDLVVSTQGKNYIAKADLAFEIPEVVVFQRKSKYDINEKGKVVQLTSLFNLKISKVENGEIVLDPCTSSVTESSPQGGEITKYFPGFLDEDGTIRTEINPQEQTFKTIRNRLKQEWGDKREIFSQWGACGVQRQYTAKDTGKSLPESIEQEDKVFKAQKKSSPLVRYNFVGYSLGAPLALEVARRNSHAVNNIILIDGPIKGLKLPKSFTKDDLAAARAGIQLRYGFDEKISQYLLDLAQNTAYHQQIEDFARDFTSTEKKLITITSSSDQFMPPDLATLQNATKIPGGSVIQIQPTGSYLKDHGALLPNRITGDIVVNALGKNLARVN